MSNGRSNYLLIEDDQVVEILRKEWNHAAKYLDFARDIVVCIGYDQKVVLVNKRGLEIMGYEEEEIIGKDWLNIITSEEMGGIEKPVFQKFLAKGLEQVESFEDVVLTKNDEERLISWRNILVTDERDKVIGSICLGEDVTEQRRTEGNLQQQELYFRSLIENSSDGIVVLGSDGNIQYQSPSHERIMGYQQRDLIGGSAFVGIHPDDIERALGLFKQLLLSNDNVVTIQVRLKHGDGTFHWFEASAKNHLKDPEIAGIVVNFSDITEYKGVVEEQERLLHNLGERIKEQYCLYEVSKIIGCPNNSIETILKGAVDVISQSLQYPTITCVRIVFEEVEYKTPNFNETIWKLSSDIVLDNEKRGVIEVYYLNEKPEIDDGPFLKEERDLIDLLSFQLGMAIEHKRFVDMLRESEERYSAIVEGANDGIVIISKDLNILFANRKVADMLGYTIEEASDLNLLKIVCPASIKEALNIFKHRMAGEDTASTYNIEIFHKDGHIVPVELNSAKIEYKGKPADLIFLRDITEREHGKEVFEKLKGNYQSLIENSPDMIAKFDEKGKILTANSKTAEFLDLPMNDIIGGRLSDLIPKENMVNAFRLMIKAIGGNEPVSYEDNINGKYYQIYLTPVEGTDKKRTFHFITHDITDRKLAEIDVVTKKRELEDTMNNMIDAVFITSLKVKIINVNDSAALLTGHTKEELIGSFPTMLLSKDSISLFFDALKKLQVGNKIESLELTVTRKDGLEVPVSINVSFTTNLKGKPDKLVVVIRDITERKKNEEKLKETLNDYKSSIGELEQFTFIASHDLQEPLRMVASYVQLLSIRYKDTIDSDADEYIDYAVEGVKRMKGMVDDLMDLSSISTTDKSLRPVECEKVLDRVISSLVIQIEKSDAEILHDPLPVVMGDKSQLIELFSNLITNAIKYRGSESPRIHISVEKRDGDWIFSVRDNGVGIEPGEIENVFKIFRRLDKRQSGTGIGLATCKRIVQHHGGRILVESELGNGSTFYFTIPLEQGEKYE